jgi:nucleoside-diphosphate-sugar epimerase
MRIKALVTGCSGFIGSHLVTALIEKDWEVYGLIRESTDDNWLKKQKVHLLKGEYRDKTALKKAVKCMDYVFHLGAIISAREWETYYRVNVQGTENLLAA